MDPTEPQAAASGHPEQPSLAEPPPDQGGAVSRAASATPAVSPAEPLPGDPGVAGPESPAARRKRALLGLLAATVIGATAVGIARWAERHAGSVATVDGARIPRGAYTELFERARARYGQRFNVDYDSPAGHQIEADLRTSVVRELVDRELVRQEAARRGVLVPDALVEAELERGRKSYPKPEQLEQMLAEQGGTLDGLRVQIAAGMRKDRLAAALAGATEPPEAEVRAYFEAHRDMYRQPEEVRARHILVKEEALARRLAAELAGGGDFATLARRHSTDPGSGSRGGDLGFFARGRMVRPFEEAAFALKPGQISKPVKSQFGWHLIKAEERRAARALPFVEVRAEIARRLGEQRRKEAFEAWLAQRRAQAAISYAEGFAPAAAPGAAGHGHEEH
ncbi:MAG: peptidylprolyl isomerase [Candidatus Sericytochromatia bacterium]|nr:peptidylprolyl isomerase [Candidatus Sericytochromatia bacterium]